MIFGKRLQEGVDLPAGQVVDSVGLQVGDTLRGLFDIGGLVSAVDVLPVGKDHQELVAVFRQTAQEIQAGQHALVEHGLGRQSFIEAGLEKVSQILGVMGLLDGDVQRFAIEDLGLIVVEHHHRDVVDGPHDLVDVLHGAQDGIHGPALLHRSGVVHHEHDIETHLLAGLQGFHPQNASFLAVAQQTEVPGGQAAHRIALVVRSGNQQLSGGDNLVGQVGHGFRHGEGERLLADSWRRHRKGHKQSGH